MPTNYPTALDAFTNPDGATDDLDSPGVNHDDQHTDANDAIEALEAKVGIVSSAVATSLDYLVNHLGGDLSGTLANAQLVASAVGTTELAALAVTDAKVATANKDGSAGTASMRTLGTGAAQAAAGNDARLSDARTPTTHSDSVHSVDYATQAELNTHEAAADPHTGYVRESLVDAPGDLFVGTAADTVARKAVGADGTVLAADSTQSDDLVWHPLPKVIRKTADETVTNSTAMQDDNHLSFAVAANDLWQVDYVVHFTGPQAADWKYEFAVPAGTTYRMAQFGVYDSGVGNGPAGVWNINYTATPQFLGVIGGATAETSVLISGLFVVGGTAGNVVLRWAQSTADATGTTVRANSFLRAIKVI